MRCGGERMESFGRSDEYERHIVVTSNGGAELPHRLEASAKVQCRRARATSNVGTSQHPNGPKPRRCRRSAWDLGRRSSCNYDVVAAGIANGGVLFDGRGDWLC